MERNQELLLQWYSNNKRDLPFRRSQDPYLIWISEVMLQQTTMTAVLPFYEKFVKSFPNVKTLANAPESIVLKHWAGLGYYSRAKRLHQAAKLLSERFPRTYAELLEVPGFGPYTARAVASLAFGESVGVVDGNVIRVLSRLYGLDVDWWKTSAKLKFQKLVDELVRGVSSSDINQALMDLGSLVCTPKSPKCIQCPYLRVCVGYQKRIIERLPRAKPRREKEIWIWRPQIILERKRMGMVENNYAPFLQQRLLPPGDAKRVIKAPETFLFRHSITHHDIYVQPKKGVINKNIKMIALKRISEVNPTSLLKKLVAKTLLVTTIIFMGCTSAEKVKQGGSSNAILTKTDIQSLRVSRDGKYLFYISGERRSHSQAQLYRLNIEKQTETRITHHDGDVLSLAPHPDEKHILYSSTTDEIKEKHQMDLWARSFQQKSLISDTHSPSEIYMSNLNGSGIRRVTRIPGYDSEVDIQKFGRIIVFTSAREGHRAIYKADLNGGSSRRISPKSVVAFSPRFSPDSKSLIWLSKNDRYLLNLSDVEMQSNEVLATFSTEPRGLAWDWDSKALLIARAKKNGGEIWRLDLNKRCWNLIHSTPNELRDPALGPDRSTIYFIERRDSESAIQSIELKVGGDCVESVVF